MLRESDPPLESSPDGLALQGSWLAGFHGAMPLLSAAPGTVSLRTLAIGPRSLGIESLAALIALPARLGPPAMPHSGVAVPVGALAEATPSPAVVEPSAPVIEPWDESEPLASYLDRRLLQARVLLLPNRGRAYRLAKRVLDVVGAVLLLMVALPVIAVLALVIRLDSPGPAIFRQQRVTLGGRLFTFYKFRTMWVDARERYPHLYDYRRTAPFGDVYYKLADDPRNTRVGRWLRRTTLDELPNLINVLKGDMTLVGPRPELPQLVPHYRPEELALFFTKAGVTGLAQIGGRSLLTVRERIALDLRYVAQQNLLLDLRILARTVVVVLTRRGAF